MKIPTSQPTPLANERASTPRHSTLLSLFSRWELYILLLVTVYLHFAYIQTFEFDDDQAALLRMAYDALHYGLLPAVSNVASISIANPPGTIFLFMIPELFSTNPLAADIFVAICTTCAIFLTYFFVSRYYGRVAAITATLLYATATRPLLYARFIWQPNLMPPFVILFLFALFEGVVRRRKGWFFPALVLFGLLYQMHPTALLLGAPLVVALLLSPGTFRWRDVGLALVCLLVIFSPYLLFEYLTKFADIRGAVAFAKQAAHFDGQALYFYRLFLVPGDANANFPGSLLLRVSRRIAWFGNVTLFIVGAGMVLLLFIALWSRSQERSGEQRQSSPLLPLSAWWTTLHSDGYRSGLLLLLVWQIVPLVILSRHSIGLHSQYFFLLMPGPFIIIGFVVAKIVYWARSSWAAFIRYGTYAIVSVLVLAQLLGSVAIVIDTGTGKFDDRAFQPYHNDLGSLQNALSAADQLAQQRHLGRVYITIDAATQSAFRYLTEGTQVHTPTTLFDASSCLILPDPTQGAAVFLVGPYDTLTNTLLARFASATLVTHVARLGVSPFSLYVVTSRPTTPAPTAFAGHLQATNQQASQVSAGVSSWLVTQWQVLRSQAPSHLATYNYIVDTSSSTHGQTTKLGQATCAFSSLQAGEQLLVAAQVAESVHTPAVLHVTAQYYKQFPHILTFGPLHLGIDQSTSDPWTPLASTNGKKYVTANV